MASIFYEKDADMKMLQNKRIAVLGFGSQGHAHAMNLKESGMDVVVGLRKDSKSNKKANDQGLETAEIGAAVKSADVVMVLLPDEMHGKTFVEQIQDNLDDGNILLFAHGFSIQYSVVVPAANVDVAMIAPKGPGHMVRREYQEGRGVPALVAVQQNYTGKAKGIALAYAAGIGAGRAGIFETTFEEETETDLFGEQAVLCGGVTSLMKAGFEILVEAGYQPEMAYFECINEMKLIIDLIYEGGFTGMRYSISNTAEYGDYITQNKIIDEDAKNRMRAILSDVQSGKFAKDWILENQAGVPSFKAMRRKARAHQLESVGKELRSMMPWLKNNIVVDD